MTIKQAWNKISARYFVKRQNENCPVQEGYELLLKGSYEMEDGQAERLVYQSMAEQAKSPEYRRLSRLLVQNLRKGNRSLIPLLEQESDQAFEGRKQMAIQLGEEASTKLLLPLVGMLIVVMVIVLAPAILNFSG